MKKYILMIILIPISIGCKKIGCTDQDALNYSELAKKDDGSCFYEEDLDNQIKIENFNVIFGWVPDPIYTLINDVSTGNYVEVQMQAYGSESWVELPHTDYYNGLYWSHSVDYNTGVLKFYCKDIDTGLDHHFGNYFEYSFKAIIN